MYQEYFLTDEDKYVSKVSDIESALIGFFKDKPIDNFDIKPVQLTLEITNSCNCNCPDCGMFANRTKHFDFDDISFKKLLKDSVEFGIPAIALTGGEPFLKFDNFCEIFKDFKGQIDIIKIISNGFWGKNPKYYFDKLISIGFFENRFFKPTLCISIGQQTVPLTDIANLINYICENFTTSDFNFTIINTRMPDQTNYSKLEELVEIYETVFGPFPKQRIILTDSNYILLSGPNVTYPASVLTCVCDNRFKLSLGKFVSPKVLVKANGDCYPCEVFQKSKHILLGNCFETSISDVIQNYNTNKYVNFIAKYGTESFNNILTSKIMEKEFASTCDACMYCINTINKNNLL